LEDFYFCAGEGVAIGHDGFRGGAERSGCPHYRTSAKRAG
jgi:hypothetical protein